MKASSSLWKLALQRGLIGGLVVVIMSLIGLVQAFNTRDLIGDVLPLGLAFLLVAFFTISYVTIRKVKPSPKEGLIAGAILGASSGLVLAAMVVVQHPRLARYVHQHSPELFEI
jgi:Na+/proline symporter